jgi:hypothetical protein
MKKIFDVETYYKGNTYREAVHADTPEEALEFITKKYSKERVTRITERKNLTN